jgi:hypothetical protein
MYWQGVTTIVTLDISVPYWRGSNMMLMSTTSPGELGEHHSYGENSSVLVIKWTSCHLDSSSLLVITGQKMSKAMAMKGPSATKLISSDTRQTFLVEHRVYVTTRNLDEVHARS